MINIAVIGCGKIAQTRHLPEYAANSDVCIKAVYDLNFDRAAEIAKQYGAMAYDSYEQLLCDSEIDAVSICVANAHHCEMSMAALRAGKHVLCEKPMAVTLEQCVEMNRAARETGKFLMIGHNQRLNRTHQMARQLICEGVIGRVLTFRTTFGHGGPETWTIDRDNVWFFDRQTAFFGAMADLGVHKTDLMRYLLGQEVKEVFARLETMDKRCSDGSLIGVDDNAVCTYVMESGIVGTMTASWTYYNGEDNSTVLYGTEGCLRIYDDPDYSLIVEKKDGSRIYYQLDRMQTNDQQTNSGIIDLWVDCLENKNPPEISGDDALKTMKVIFAAAKSAETGASVLVN